MNPMPEENKIPEEEESTIFTASPVRERKRQQSGGKKRVIAIVASLLSLLVVALSIFAVSVLIPKTDEGSSSYTENPTVTGLTNLQVESVTVDGVNGETTFIAELAEKDGEQSVSWSIKGVSADITEPVMISSYMDTVLRMREMRKVTVDADMDYGFSKPEFKVTVKGRTAEDNRGYIIGKELFDGSGNYARREGESEIFVISSEDIELLSQPVERFSISTVVPAAKAGEKDGDYFKDGALSRFDKITVDYKGGETISFAPNPSTVTSSVIASVMTSPSERFAEDELVDKIFSTVSEGLFAEHAYRYNPTAADLREFGLENPELTVTLEYADERIVYKASAKDFGYFAVIANTNPDIIFKVAAEELPFAEYSEIDFASPHAFVERLSEIKKLTFDRNGVKTQVDVTYFEEEDSETDFIIKIDGRTVDSEVFISYYDYLLGIELNEVTFKPHSGRASFAIELEYADGSGKKEFKFIEYSSRRYYMEVNGTPLGYIASSYVEKLTDYLSLAIKNEKVPEAF